MKCILVERPGNHREGAKALRRAVIVRSTQLIKESSAVTSLFGKLP